MVMSPFQQEGSDGFFNTRNPTKDPRYPEGSTYWSTGYSGNNNHLTLIYGPDDQLIKDSPGMDKLTASSADLLVNRLVNR